MALYHKKEKPPTRAVQLGTCWCDREDLNLHELLHKILSLARLPFRHGRIAIKYYINKVSGCQFVDLEGFVKA